MLCERIYFNLDQHPPGFVEAHRIDAVELHWPELSRRALRKRSRSGAEVRILLPLGVRLRHGDVIGDESGRLVAVDVQACEVWIARPVDARMSALAALELGNLHIPAEVSTSGEIIVCPDGPVSAIFHRYGLIWETAVRRFAPLRCEGLIVKAAPNFSIRKSPAPSPSTHEQARI